MLKPTKSYIKNGLRIKEYDFQKASLSAAAPFISIFYLAPLPSKRMGCAAEDIARESIYGKIQFISDYYIDRNNIWIITPIRQAHITITLCEDIAPAQDRLLKILQEIYKQRNFTQRELSFFFKNKELENKIRSNLLNLGCDYPITFEEELQEENASAAQLTYEVLQLDKWTTTPLKEYPIQSIKIQSPSPIKYRVHYYHSNWSAWVGNGIPTQRGNIDGFQFIYEGQEQFSYRCGFKNKPFIKWTTRNIPLPYNIPVTQFECKIE